MKTRLFVLLCAGLLFTGCGRKVEESNDTGAMSETQLENTEAVSADTSEEAQEEDAYVLSFEAVTTDGEVLTSDCFAQSKLTMLNVWATYCNPCLSEMPDLGELAASYDTAEFQMIGVVSDVAEGDEDNIAYAKELITETKADYPHLILNQSLYENLVGGIDSVPTTFFVNKKGEVLGYVIGAQSKEAWEGVISELLAEME